MTYYIYHIPGQKIGVTRDLNKRVTAQQGYAPDEYEVLFTGEDIVLELTWSADYTATCPEDLIHTALGVPDIIEYCDKVEKAGIEIWPSGWREKFAGGENKMAFVTDPDGYEVEILER